MSIDFFKQISYNCLLELCTPEGLNASSRNEAYGCVFGRDTAITILKLLSVYGKTRDKTLLQISKIPLLTLAELQGTTENIESGEQPGKIIHEFRRDNYERLIKRVRPWYVYSDGTIRNYDSVDATPLTLIAWHKYWTVSGDDDFLLRVLPHVEKALQWIITTGDRDGDYFLEYELMPERKHGGLAVQSWTDSFDSLKYADGSFPKYPIAPIEVQSYSWLALRLWSGYYRTTRSEIADHLDRFARNLRIRFNMTFINKEQDSAYGIQALDGSKHPIGTVTANPLLCLWASASIEDHTESIVAEEYIPAFVKRAFRKDLFDEDGGLRTMSTQSPTYNPTVTSYHNGSFWPILNGLVYEGLQTWGFEEEALRLKNASLKAIEHFKTPIELYILNDGYKEFTSAWGKRGCRYQAWSAAAILDMIS